MDQIRPRLKSSHMFLFSLVLIILLVLLSFLKILKLPFTGTDTLTLIETSRVKSLEDVVRQFSQPMMAGTTFAQHWKYFRPLSTLSFSFDFYLWGLKPWGYHLTDLLLHLFNTALLFIFVYRMTSGRTVLAALSASIFTLHPVLSQSVPVISRRQDLIATFFIFLSLLLLMHYIDSSSKRRRGHLALSVLFCVFAMGAKETGFLAPLFILTYVLLLPEHDSQSWKERLKHLTPLSTLYFLAAFLFLIWRTAVLGGLGIKSLDALDQTFRRVKEIAIGFFTGLVDPSGAIDAQLKRMMSPHPTNTQIVVSLVSVVLFLAILFHYRVALFKQVRERKNAVTRMFVGVLLGMFILSFLAILAYPMLAPVLSEVIEDATHGRGLKIIVDAMEGRENTPVESYLLRARDYVLRTSHPILIYVVFSLVALGVSACSPEGIRRKEDRVLLLMCSWLLFTLALFMFTSTASRRSMYFAVAGFSTILAIVAVRCGSVFVEGIRGASEIWLERDIAFRRLTSTLSLVLTCIVVGFLILRGPLFGLFPKWERNGVLSEIFFSALGDEVHALPSDAQLKIVGLPSLTESSLMDYTVKSWLDLNYPDNGMTVVFGDRVSQVECLDCLNINIDQGDGNHFEVLVDFAEGIAE